MHTQGRIQDFFQGVPKSFVGNFFFTNIIFLLSRDTLLKYFYKVVLHDIIILNL